MAQNTEQVAAEREAANRCYFTAPDDQYEQFVALLESPVTDENTAKLRTLFAMPDPVL